MLELNNLQYHLHGKSLLDIEQLTFIPGQFSALIGPNGAGKSTLFKAIAGEIKTKGKCYLHGQELAHWNRLERAKHLAILPQASHLNFPFFAREVVALGATPLSIKQIELEQQIRRVMQLSDSSSLADQPYPSLSGGEKQRVHLARVLLQLCQARNAPVLLLDEPTSAQDLGQQHKMLAQLKAFCRRENAIVIAVLHDLNQVLRYCDHCVILDQGHVAHSGSPQQVLTPPTVNKHWAYLPQQAVVDGRTQLL